MPAPATTTDPSAVVPAPGMTPPPILPPQPTPPAMEPPGAPPALPAWSSTGAPVPPDLDPPRIAAPRVGDTRPGDLTPEERSAQRQQRFKEMRERVIKRHEERIARLDAYWKVIDAMTPEQKEAIEAIFGAGKARCMHRAGGRPMHRGAPMSPRFRQPEQGFPGGSTTFPGYGYGPQGGEPYPFDRGPASSWFGEQPMPFGGPQRRYGPDQNSFQGPPPPVGEQTRP